LKLINHISYKVSELNFQLRAIVYFFLSFERKKQFFTFDNLFMEKKLYLLFNSIIFLFFLIIHTFLLKYGIINMSHFWLIILYIVNQTILLKNNYRDLFIFNNTINVFFSFLMLAFVVFFIDDTTLASSIPVNLFTVLMRFLVRF